MKGFPEEALVCAPTLYFALALPSAVASATLICHEALRDGVLLTSCLVNQPVFVVVAVAAAAAAAVPSFRSLPLTRAGVSPQHRHHGTNRPGGRFARPSHHNMDDAADLLGFHAAVFNMRPRVQWTVVQSYKQWPSAGQHGMLAASHPGSCLADMALCGLGILFSRIGLSCGIHECLHGDLRAKTAVEYAIQSGAVGDCHRLLPNVS